MDESTKATIKKIILAIIFGTIAYLAIIFIMSTWVILTILTVVGLALFGAYTVWEKYAKNELMKKEENFSSLKEDK